MKRVVYLFVAILIAVGAGYYISIEMDKLRKEILAIEQESQRKLTANEYKGWKTYSNDKLEYAFKYPPDWNIETKETETSGFTVNLSPGRLSENIFSNIISIYQEGPGIGCTERPVTLTTKEFEIGGKKKEVVDFCGNKTSWVIPVVLGKAPMANVFIAFAGYSEASQADAKLVLKSLTNTKIRE